MLTHKHKEVAKIHENFRENVDYEQFLLFGEVRSASQKKISVKNIDVSELRGALGVTLMNRETH